MAELKEPHFEIIDSNKARAHERAKKDQEKMRIEVKEFAETCNVLDLQKMFLCVKDLRRKS